MAALGRHFELDLGDTSDLGKVFSLRRFFYRDTQMGLSMARNATLKRMVACVKSRWDINVSPRETLRRFTELDEVYVASASRDPRPVQDTVRKYMAAARNLP